VKLQVIGQCFDSPDAHEMSQRVLEAYQNFGYFRAMVTDPAIKVMDDTRYPKPVSLTFDVEEGQQFMVADVIWHWKGTDGFGDEQLSQLTSVRAGDFFDTSKDRETVEG
jgi:outer membrane protein assembly factor BamA